MVAAHWIALAIAVFGAFSYAVGSILQAVGARRSVNTVSTLGHPLYLIGIFLDILAWVGAMIALQSLAVYVVESVLAGSLAITAVFAWLFLKSKLRRRDVVAIVATTTALTVLTMSAGHQAEIVVTREMRIAFCAGVLAVWVLGWGAVKIGSPGLIAAVGGLSLGGAALTGRAVHLPPGAMDGFASAVLAIATEPLVYTLLAYPLTGMVLYANALRKGEVGRVTAVHWTGEVVAPSVIALTVLGDTVRPGWALTALLAGLTTIGAAVVLASAPAATVSEAAAAEATAAAGQAGGVPAPVPIVATPQGAAVVAIEAWRRAIPPEAHWPALQPPLIGGYGTYLWMRSATGPQPVWVAPNRSLTARDQSGLAQPSWTRLAWTHWQRSQAGVEAAAAPPSAAPVAALRPGAALQPGVALSPVAAHPPMALPPAPRRAAVPRPAAVAGTAYFLPPPPVGERRAAARPPQPPRHDRAGRPSAA